LSIFLKGSNSGPSVVWAGGLFMGGGFMAGGCGIIF
jgi:hypothetical protein